MTRTQIKRDVGTNAGTRLVIDRILQITGWKIRVKLKAEARLLSPGLNRSERDGHG
jgi:hypothetical protein